MTYDARTIAAMRRQDRLRDLAHGADPETVTPHGWALCRELARTAQEYALRAQWHADSPEAHAAHVAFHKARGQVERYIAGLEAALTAAQPFLFLTTPVLADAPPSPAEARDDAA